MMTRMCETETIDKLVAALADVNAKVVRGYDFTQERENVMVVVTVDSAEQVNFGLDDYKLNVTILVDSLITEDPEAKKLYEVKSQVDNVVRNIEDLRPDFSSIFGDVPVVGCYHLSTDEYSMTDSSVQVKKHLNVIISY